MAWWAKLISIFDRFGRNAEKADNKRHGAMQVDLKNREAYDESRDDAKEIGKRKHNRFKRRGVQRK